MLLDTVPQEYLKRRISAVETAIAGLGVDGLLVVCPAHKGYLSGFTCGLHIAPAGVLLITGPGRDNYCATSGTDEELCREGVEARGFTVTAYRYTRGGTVTGETVRLAAELGLRRLAVEGAYISVAECGQFCNALAAINVDLVTCGPVVDPLRETKDPWEVEQIRKANEVSRAAFEHVIRLIKPGMTEWDVAVHLETVLRQGGSGSSRLAFPSVVVSGPRSSLPHGQPTARRLETGDFVTLDFGATWNGYCADVTRTFVVGRASDRQREVYGAVLEAQLAAMELMRPGRERDEAGKTAMGLLADRGLGEYMAHGVGGHGIGLEVHEGPRARLGGPWHAGNVCTMEPGVYIPGWGGVRIEDDVLITADGRENLTLVSKELLEL